MKRRAFVASTAGLAASLAAARAVRLAHAGAKTHRVALVGTGWFGMVDLRHLMELGPVEVVALADPDRKALDAAADEVAAVQKERPKAVADFREILRPGTVDLVLVGSPDHWHALHALAAMEAGADVYLQKPICHTFLEGRAMVNAARRRGRVVQVGTQRRSTAHTAQARELVREGKLGHVGLVRAICHYQMRGNDAPADEPPPPHLDWELWTGPAPLRPYNPAIHPKRWRCFEEYSNGILGDMAIHMFDLMRWYLDLGYPKRISSTGGIFVETKGRGNVPDTQTVTYEYDGLTAVWEHRTYGAPDDPKFPWGIVFYGEKANLRVCLDWFELVPNERGGKTLRVEAVKEPDPTKVEGEQVRPAGRAHMRNFLDCVASRERPIADIEQGFVSTALTQFGNIAQRVGRTLTWDARRERFVADEPANRRLLRAYRKPWVYPTA